ncbi:MAG: hypothetical protein GX442_18845 [Candidatus Riflebacteria bacterium]|nr:hypothetical protein [Candidatus Riflebacteria bacterium]
MERPDPTVSVICLVVACLSLLGVTGLTFDLSNESPLNWRFRQIQMGWKSFQDQWEGLEAEHPGPVPPYPRLLLDGTTIFPARSSPLAKGPVTLAFPYLDPYGFPLVPVTSPEILLAAWGNPGATFPWGDRSEKTTLRELWDHLQVRDSAMGLYSFALAGRLARLADQARARHRRRMWRLALVVAGLLAGLGMLLTQVPGTPLWPVLLVVTLLVGVAMVLGIPNFRDPSHLPDAETLDQQERADLRQALRAFLENQGNGQDWPPETRKRLQEVLEDPRAALVR